jgi:hypothetical protein
LLNNFTGYRLIEAANSTQFLVKVSFGRILQN